MSKILVWLLICIHCMPMSISMTPVMIPALLFQQKKSVPHASRIIPQPIKLKLRMPTFFTYFPTKDAVKAPAMPQSPSMPMTSLDAWNGASPILNARQDHMARNEPKASPARIE